MFTVRDEEHGGHPSVVLRDEASGSSATIVPSRGAITTSFVAAGREWLYLDEATLRDPQQNVRGGIPVLFPSPGKLAGDTFTWEGKTGRMKQHGFARTSTFNEVARDDEGSASVELELVDSDATRAQFPFPFQLRLQFRLGGSRLHIRARVVNRGSTRMPFGLGYHPYFAVPSHDKAACRIPVTRAWDNKNARDVELGPIDFAAGEVDMHLVDYRSNGATLVAPTGEVELGGHFDRWVIWTLPERDFICLEPWSCAANALNGAAGTIVLPPEGERAFDLTMVVRPSV